MSAPRILVVGSGSAGTRHARNLVSLGAEIAVVDARPERVDNARSAIPADAGFPTLDAALAAGSYDGAVVATPTSFHVDQTIALVDAGLPVLLEKPVAPSLREAQRLKAFVDERGVPVLLGYTYRWWPAFVELRRRLADGAIGRVRHARFVMSAHLADWHPWERYQDFFMSSAELGGGALLDESHFLDLMVWLFGMPQSISGRVERISDLEITADDNVDALAAYPDGLRVSIHLDLYGRPHERMVTVVGENGTLQVTITPNELRQGSGPAEWERTTFDCDRNEMFLAAAREFAELVAGRAQTPSCTIADGILALECVESVRSSSEAARTIGVTGRAGR